MVVHSPYNIALGSYSSAQDALAKSQNDLLAQWPQESDHGFNDRKQLFSAGIATVTSFAEWQNMAERFPRYLNAEQATALKDLGIQCCHFFFLSAQVAAGQSQLRWLIIPKLHIFVHICLDVERERYNSRSYHCFSGEDYMGYLKLVAQSSPKQERFEERMLKRSLLKVITSTPAALERLVIGKS
eukprot:s1915_g10.t1